jgi:hypothetical protein
LLRLRLRLRLLLLLLLMDGLVQEANAVHASRVTDECRVQSALLRHQSSLAQRHVRQRCKEYEQSRSRARDGTFGRITLVSNIATALCAGYAQWPSSLTSQLQRRGWGARA